MINILETDVEENALDSLEMAAELLTRKDLKHQWKWVSIALFNALYGFCISAIRGTTPDRVLEPLKCKSCKKLFGPFWILGNSKKCPSCGNDFGKIRIKLVDFEEAFNRVQDDGWMKQFVFSRIMVFTDSQKKKVEKLQKFYRNNFEHMSPMLWAFPNDNQEIVSEVTEVIEKLVLESGNIAHHLEKEGVERFRKAVEKIRQSIASNPIMQQSN